MKNLQVFVTVNSSPKCPYKHGKHFLFCCIFFFKWLISFVIFYWLNLFLAVDVVAVRECRDGIGGDGDIFDVGEFCNIRVGWEKEIGMVCMKNSFWQCGFSCGYCGSCFEGRHLVEEVVNVRQVINLSFFLSIFFIGLDTATASFTFATYNCWYFHPSRVSSYWEWSS